jgi:hypothetical protein
MDMVPYEEDHGVGQAQDVGIHHGHDVVEGGIPPFGLAVAGHGQLVVHSFHHLPMTNLLQVLLQMSQD